MNNARLLFVSLLVSLVITAVFYYTLGTSSAKRLKRMLNGDTEKRPVVTRGERKRQTHAKHIAVRLLCLVPTSASSQDSRAVAVRDTWGRRCDKTLFFGSRPDDSFPVIALPGVKDGTAEELPAKMMSIFSYAFDNHQHDFDWILKADVDTYIIVDNLRYLLSSLDPDVPINIGHRLRVDRDREYFSGGAGYVMSRSALRYLVQRGLRDDEFKQTVCRRRIGAEDVVVGECLSKLGVKFVPSLGPDGKETFHPFSPATHLMGGFPEWYSKYRNNDTKQGSECCSRYSVSFHFIDPVMMHVMDHLLYNTDRVHWPSPTS